MTLKLDDEYDFELTSVNQNFELIYGDVSAEQTIKVILKTFEGENRFYPEFGTRIQDIIGYNTPTNYIKYVIKSSILKDVRFSAVENIQVIKHPNHTITVSLDVTVVDTGSIIGGLITW